MLIDWFTVAAQVINFLVLVALTKHFLWGRLLRVVDEREKRIAAEIKQAEEKNKAAGQMMEQVKARERDQEQKQEELMTQARKVADEQRGEMVKEARKSVEKSETLWRSDLEHEKTAFLVEVRRRSATEIFTIVRQVLTDLASSDLQQRAIETFLQRLKGFDLKLLRELMHDDAVLKSASQLSEETRHNIQTALEKQLGEVLHLHFEVDPALAWGLELCGNGQKIGWSSKSYLDRLEENLKEALDRKTEAEYQVAAS